MSKSKSINGMANPIGGAVSAGGKPLGQCYTMAVEDDGEAVITMYGDIVEEIPRDWWTGEPIPGMYIALENFLEDLKAVEKAKSVLIRLHSVGGDAYASITIHNRLRELARKVALNVIVDGVAMSGGSLIMCAGNTVKVNPSSIIMVHTCWRFMFGGYNSAELRKIADGNDTVDKAQAVIYKGKTGMSSEDIIDLMEAETYMTGGEAVEWGFADELVDGERLGIAASADRRTLYIGNRVMRIPGATKLPDTFNIPTVTAAQADAINKNMPLKTGGGEGGPIIPIPKTTKDLRKEYPDLCAQIEAAAATADPKAVNEAVTAEQKRLQEIDNIAVSINDDKLIAEAKYGDKACSAQELAYRAMQEQAKQGARYLKDTREDYNESGASGVQSTVATTDSMGPSSPQQRMAQGRADAKAMQNK